MVKCESVAASQKYNKCVKNFGPVWILKNVLRTKLKSMLSELYGHNNFFSTNILEADYKAKDGVYISRGF